MVYKEVTGMQKFLIGILSILFLFGCSSKNKKTTPKKKVEDIIPLTAANMRGHKALYNEGWFVVTSSKRSLAFANRYGVQSSKQAIIKTAKRIVKNSKTYKKDMTGLVKKSYDLSVQILKEGQKETVSIWRSTHALGKGEKEIAVFFFKKSWKSLIKGNLTLLKRTKADRKNFMAVPGGYFKNLSEDFKNLFFLTKIIHDEISKKISLSWKKSFEEASTEFKKEYEKSGKKANSLMAMGNILSGYLKAFYYGLVKPSAKSIVKVTALGTNYGIFLPTAAVAVVSGRTIQATGVTLYYVSKMGIKLVSPTIESGFLSGLGLLSLATIPPTYAVGGTYGVINQVAYSIVAPTAGVTSAVGQTAYHTGKYVAFVSANIATGATKVIINQISSGLVLGYNALTAIPVHLFLLSVDSAIFLAWDGPRLVIAAVQGKIGKSSAGDLPVGTVVDLKKLQKIKGVKVRIITKDPKIIKKVLKRIPKDLRVKPSPEKPSEPVSEQPLKLSPAAK
jgi:hypothetical protein